jgi:hypothetical protein
MILCDAIDAMRFDYTNDLSLFTPELTVYLKDPPAAQAR